MRVPIYGVFIDVQVLVFRAVRVLRFKGFCLGFRVRG